MAPTGTGRERSPRIVIPPSPEYAPTTAADQSRWFAEEVHRHDGRLKAYLRTAYPSVGDVDDVVQESYLRVWRARTAQPIQSAKAFLFRVARNVALDLIRHGRSSPIDAVGDTAALPVIDDRPGVAERVSSDERLNLLADAIATLPPRCRETMMLCQIKGLTHHEAARQLGLSEKTVDEHIYRGLQRLGAELRKQGVSGC